MIDVIPAVDIIDGQLVRLSQGDYAEKKVYCKDPVEMARQFEDAGLKRLHVVDLDGALQKHIVNWRTLENIATKTNLIIDFGGGVKSDEDVKVAFECGADMIVCGSIAVHRPALFLDWLDHYGAEKIVLGADIKKGKIAVTGWTESSDAGWQTFLHSYVSRGVRKVISTDISRDGMMDGPSVELYKDMMQELPELEVTASGGVSSLYDIVCLDEVGIPAVIVGKAIYEGRITMKELEQFQYRR